MIRNFVYDPNVSYVAEVLTAFGFDAAHKQYSLALLRFEVITPDSFMWRLLVNNAIYYLYAEDYVSGLAKIKNVFNSYLETTKWELVSPVKIIKFEEASPVKSAVTYAKPNDHASMMQYAADSGHDFVFLAKSSENADDAQFSDEAPRGFAGA
ncbi:hypothetical protein H7171_01830 [Candidatus Saccharibacteria bacterium]|nr:hypothetical protein [Candidatus Saccharibacteria bacterium]